MDLFFFRGLCQGFESLEKKGSNFQKPIHILKKKGSDYDSPFFSKNTRSISYPVPIPSPGFDSIRFKFSRVGEKCRFKLSQHFKSSRVKTLFLFLFQFSCYF